MARIASLSQLNESAGKDYLAESYGKVIDNVAKSTISSIIKNTDLSGDPTTGTVEAKRFTNTSSKAYGTARSGGAGQKNVVRPVTIAIDVDRELIHEVEEKDTALYGVDGLISRKSAQDEKSMERELERAFFIEAAVKGTRKTSFTATAALDKFEEFVQGIENTSNDFVDGVDRDMIHVVMNTATYGELRTYIDTNTNNASVNTGIAEMGTLHGVKVYSSVYLPSGVTRLGMAEGSVAQPVRTVMDEAGKFPASNAYHFGMFYSYGCEAVMPDLIQYVADALANLTVTVADSATAGATALTVTAYTVAGVSAASYAYKVIGASAGTVPCFGDTVTGYTAFTTIGTAFDVATTNNYYIIVVALDADGNVLAGKQVQAVIA